MPTKKRKPTSDAIEILHRRHYEGKSDRLAALAEAEANDEVARRIVELRTQSGLSQRDLAKRVGTTASVICRLEDADYDGGRRRLRWALTCHATSDRRGAR